MIKASQPDPSDPGPAASRTTPGSLMGFGVRRLARLAPPTQPPDKKVQRTVDATSVSCPPLKGPARGPPMDTPTGPTRVLLFAKTRPLQKPPRVRFQTRSAWPFLHAGGLELDPCTENGEGQIKSSPFKGKKRHRTSLLCGRLRLRSRLKPWAGRGPGGVWAQAEGGPWGIQFVFQFCLSFFQHL